MYHALCFRDVSGYGILVEVNTDMHSFWLDKEHMKNCFGVGKKSKDGNIYSDTILKFRFNDRVDKSDLRELVNAMIKVDQMFSIERGC